MNIIKEQIIEIEKKYKTKEETEKMTTRYLIEHINRLSKHSQWFLRERYRDNKSDEMKELLEFEFAFVKNKISEARDILNNRKDYQEVLDKEKFRNEQKKIRKSSKGCQRKNKQKRKLEKQRKK